MATIVRRKFRPGAWALVAATAIILAAMVALLKASFPSLVDHTSRAVVLWATGVTVASVFLAYLLLPPSRRGWPWQLGAVGAMVLGGGVLFYTGGSASPVRMRFYEYAAISRAHWGSFEGLWHHKSTWEGTVEPTAPPPRVAPVALPESVQDWPRRKPLIILLIWDAARPDHMSLYGYKRNHPPYHPTTPNLDAVRDDLTWISPAFSQGTATTCSLRHLFTARHSSRFMLKKKGIGPFWTNDLVEAGYDLLLNIIGTDYNGISKEAFLRDMPPALRRQAKITAFDEQIEHRQGQRVLEHIDRRGGGRGLFAFIHMTATHFPWKPRPATPDFGTGHRNLYDHSMAYCDMGTGLLIRGLKQRGLWDDCMLIVTADHGTGLGEHGRYGGFHPYYEQVHVPLVLKLPGMAGQGPVKELAALFDIGPTLVEPFFPDRLTRFHGESLWPALLDKSRRGRPRVLFGMSSFEDCYTVLTSEGWHYTWHRWRKYEKLYHWLRDPAEKSLLLDNEKALRHGRSLMTWYLREGKGKWTNPYHYRACDEAAP